jgi:hypothetical protein
MLDKLTQTSGYNSLVSYARANLSTMQWTSRERTDIVACVPEVMAQRWANPYYHCPISFLER